MTASDYKQYFPSAKLMRIFGAIAISALLIFAVSALGQYRRAAQEQKNLAIVQSSPEVLALDTDGDGLKDWEEALWGTNIHVRDTDGDGTSDGDEVKAGRNPLVAGPNDLLSATVATLGIAKETRAVLSKTDSFAREIFAAVAEQQRTTGAVDTSKISADSLSYAQSIISKEATHYAMSDLAKIGDDDPSAIRAYGNTVGKLLLSFQNADSEMGIVTEALQTNDPAMLKSLAPIVDSYHALIKNLLAVPTPPAVRYAHLSLINALSDVATSISDMQQLLSDPLLGMAGFGSYQKSEEKLASAITAIRSVCTAKSVIFSASESGHIFNR